MSEHMQVLHPALAAVTRRVVERGALDRRAYLQKVTAARLAGPQRATLSCVNLAHGIAACSQHEKHALAASARPNIANGSADVNHFQAAARYSA
jgi:phosphogluconate dehydratase